MSLDVQIPINNLTDALRKYIVNSAYGSERLELQKTLFEGYCMCCGEVVDHCKKAQSNEEPMRLYEFIRQYTVNGNELLWVKAPCAYAAKLFIQRHGIGIVGEAKHIDCGEQFGFHEGLDYIVDSNGEVLSKLITLVRL